MEDLMLGTMRTVPFWRPKKQRLAVERALAPERMSGLRNAVKPQSLADERARSRVAAEAKRKARFSEL
jgi:hypothetical protein